MGFIDKMNEWDKKLEESKQKDKQKYQAKKERFEKEKHQPKTEQEKLHKAGNTIIKGASIWFLIPFIAVFLIIATFVGFWIWDMLAGLF